MPIATRPAIPTALAALALLLAAARPAVADAATPRVLTGRAIAAAASTLASGERVRLAGIHDADALRDTDADLERFEVFTADARILVSGRDGAREVAPPQRVYLRGHLVNDLDSRVTLVVEPDGSLHGLASDESGFSSLAEGRDGGVELRRVDTASAAGDAKPIGCAGDPAVPGAARDGDELPFLAAADQAAAAPDLFSAAAVTPAHTARVAIDTDFELWQRFGPCVVSGVTTCDAQLAAVTKYVGDLVAYISTVYSGEIGTSLQVSYLRLWGSSGDPWTQSSPICNLFQLGKTWNDTQSGVSRTIVHMMSGKSNGGGVAWLGVLCSGAFNVATSGNSCTFTDSSNYGGAYGYTGNMSGGFNPASPSVVWDVMAVAHEIGHNFNSPHTHCYRNIGGDPNPVDGCYASEWQPPPAADNGCFHDGSAALPGIGTATGGSSGTGAGTIMSYCHLRSGGYSNVTMTFGTGHPYGRLPGRVPSRMQSHVASRAGSNPSCLAYVAPPSPVLFGDSFETGSKAQWH